MSTKKTRAISQLRVIEASRADGPVNTCGPRGAGWKPNATRFSV
jgi:hypothetical protein